MNDSVDRDEWLVKKAVECLKRPDDFGWFGGDEMFVTWSFAGINLLKNADDVLNESNFHVISTDLMNKFPDDFDIVGSNHWAWGSIDQLRVRVLKNDSGVAYENLTEAFKALMEWHETLMDYPVADEYDFSDREDKAMIDDLTYRLEHDDPFKYVIHVAGDHEELAWDLVSEINDMGSWCSYSEPASDEDILEAAFNLGYCKFEEAEYWNEWAESNKKQIVWNHYTNLGGKRYEIPGQLKLDV